MTGPEHYAAAETILAKLAKETSGYDLIPRSPEHMAMWTAAFHMHARLAEISLAATDNRRPHSDEWNTAINGTIR